MRPELVLKEIKHAATPKQLFYEMVLDRYYNIQECEHEINRSTFWGINAAPMSYEVVKYCALPP